MGLFGKLFDKKSCAICGGEIGLLGNKKLEDGNLCKECAGKLSPLFSERRHSTVEEIRAQLQYREENKARVASFVPTAIFGDNTKLYVDTAARTFIVTGSSAWQKANPDVIDFASITAVTPEVREDRTEVTREGEDGKRVSLETKRYDYSYDFYLTIQVNCPYFDRISLHLNNSDVEGTDRPGCEKYVAMLEDAVQALTGERPSLMSQVPERAPFCRQCGRELTPAGLCPNCSRGNHGGIARKAEPEKAPEEPKPVHGGIARKAEPEKEPEEPKPVHGGIARH